MEELSGLHWYELAQNEFFRSMSMRFNLNWICIIKVRWNNASTPYDNGAGQTNYSSLLETESYQKLLSMVLHEYSLQTYH